MRAFVYTEKWSRTKDSDKPVTYYVISFTENSKNPNHIHKGCSKMTSVDESHIREEIMNTKRRPDVTSILGRLPPNMKTVETLVLEDQPKRPSVVITREGYDLSFLRGR